MQGSGAILTGGDRLGAIVPDDHPLRQILGVATRRRQDSPENDSLLASGPEVRLTRTQTRD